MLHFRPFQAILFWGKVRIRSGPPSPSWYKIQTLAAYLIELHNDHLEVNDHTTGQNIFTSARRLKAADIPAIHYWVAARGTGALRNSRSWGGWLFNPGLRSWVAPKWYRGGLVRLLHLFYRGIMNAFVPLITFLIEWAISKPCEYNFIRAIFNLRFFFPRIKHDKAKACNSYIGII